MCPPGSLITHFSSLECIMLLKLFSFSCFFLIACELEEGEVSVSICVSGILAQWLALTENRVNSWEMGYSFPYTQWSYFFSVRPWTSVTRYLCTHHYLMVNYVINKCDKSCSRLFVKVAADNPSSFLYVLFPLGDRTYLFPFPMSLSYLVVMTCFDHIISSVPIFYPGTRKPNSFYFCTFGNLS